jgi:hypothetical protein
MAPGIVKAETPFDYLQQSLVKVVAASTLINLTEYDYEYGNCLYGAYLEAGESKTLNKYFQAGVEYVILGAGDDYLSDIDLSATSNTTGGIMAIDDADDCLPIIRFTPQSSQWMGVKITNSDYFDPGFCVMVVLRKTNSGNFSMYELAEALDNVIVNSRVAYMFTSGFARDAFCLFGGSVKEGDGSYIYNVSLKSKSYLMVGAGSDNVEDVDIYAIRQNGYDVTEGVIEAEDTETNNHPFCIFDAQSGQSYLLKYKNYSSYGSKTGFVFTVLLEM